MIKRNCRTFVAALGLLLAAGGGCKKEEAAQNPTASPANTAQLETKLASADAHDGAADKVVGDCLMCGLRMKGQAENASTHAGYTLHFCSPACKKHFDENPETAVAALDSKGQ